MPPHRPDMPLHCPKVVLAVLVLVLVLVHTRIYHILTAMRFVTHAQDVEPSTKRDNLVSRVSSPRGSLAFALYLVSRTWKHRIGMQCTTHTPYFWIVPQVRLPLGLPASHQPSAAVIPPHHICDGRCHSRSTDMSFPRRSKSACCQRRLNAVALPTFPLAHEPSFSTL